MSALKFVGKHMKRHKGKIIISLVLSIVISLVSSLGPYIMKLIVDVGIPEGRIEYILILSSMAVAVYFLYSMGNFLLSYIFTLLSETVNLDIKKEIYNKLMYYPLSFFGNKEKGYILARTNEINSIKPLFSSTTCKLGLSIIEFVIASVFLFSINTSFTICIYLFLPIYFLLIKMMMNKTRYIVGKNMEEGVNIANAVAGTKFMDEEFSVLTNNGKEVVNPEDISPYAYARSMPNTTSNEVSYRYGFNGTCCTMATGCTTGIDSIGFAYDQIRCGELDVMICGAAEAPITPITIAAFEAIGTLSTNNNPPEKASRPFDDTRNGFVLAEAAGILVLEELRHALNRGAHIYGEIAGYGSVNNAMHMTGLKPDGEDLSRAIKIAIEEANITPFEMYQMLMQNILIIVVILNRYFLSKLFLL